MAPAPQPLSPMTRRMLLATLGLVGVTLPRWFKWAGAPSKPVQPARAGMIPDGAIAQIPAGVSNEVRIVVEGDYRYIYSNGIPSHGVGSFPNNRNPNTIAAQEQVLRVPAYPTVASEVTPLGLGAFGVAVNGVLLEPGAAEFWQGDPSSGWHYDALSGAVDLGLDANNAHVQPGGKYHYHGEPTGLIEQLGNGDPMILLGYAADGFPIYNKMGYVDATDAGSGVRVMRSSYRIKSGQRPSGPGGRYDGSFVEDYEYVAGLGDLDVCNGRFGVTPDYTEGIYHYVITDEFPFISRQFRGTPDPSFSQQSGPPPGQRPSGQQGPPPDRQGPPPGDRPPGPPPGRPPGPPPSR